MQASHKVSTVFDDPNLIGSAGLVPVMRLAELAGPHELLESHLSVGSPNAAVKTTGVIAGMLAGADSIDDLDVLRHGGLARVFTGARAPSTYGTFLPAFTFGHVRQLDAVAARTQTSTPWPPSPARPGPGRPGRDTAAVATAGIVTALNSSQKGTSVARGQLFDKGLIYSPEYGHVAFTVPRHGRLPRPSGPGRQTGAVTVYRTDSLTALGT